MNLNKIRSKLAKWIAPKVAPHAPGHRVTVWYTLYDGRVVSGVLDWADVEASVGAIDENGNILK